MYKVNQVREVVAALLAMKSNKIEIMEEPMSPLFIPLERRGHSWWNGAEQHHDTIGLYHESTGLVWCEGISREWSYSRNGEREHEAGESLADYCSRKAIIKFDFVIVKYKGKHYGEEGQWYEGVAIYKAPDPYNECLPRVEV